MNDLRARLCHLAQNLWWTWSPDSRTLLDRIDPELWATVDHNPSAFLNRVGDDKLDEAARNPQLLAQVGLLEQGLATYLEDGFRWAKDEAPALISAPIAYFSPEFALHESLPIYSGGLGVLAGDHLKSCSDLGVPVYGVSLLYTHGYFRQSISRGGDQVESYPTLDVNEAPVERVLDADGQPLVIEFAVDRTTIRSDVWQTRVGRCTLVLLDPQESSKPIYPHALRLYGGGTETRIYQEIVLGVGGYRALRAMGIDPGVMHLNEGHSAFATLEAIADRMEATGQDFAEASARVASRVVFTTHTPVEAGHDRFDPGLVLHHMEPLRLRLGLDEIGFLALGRTNLHDNDETFCMTTLAIKLSQRRNGVSALHGEVSRRMWQSLWPERAPEDVPIGHITNGVHVPTWLNPDLNSLYAEYLGQDWLEHQSTPKMWRRITALPAERLWEVKQRLKQQLLAHVDEVVTRSNRENGSDQPSPRLAPDRLTIGFARRFAVYKRSFLLFEDIDRTRAMLLNPERPVQIVVAGKAHPADEPGKHLIQRLIELGRDPELRDHIVFVPGYDVTTSRFMVSGCDLWLNQPRRPLEACGTSGMKAMFNATLNCSTLDGWWNEAWDTENGFAIGERRGHANPELHDAADALSLHDVLEQQVIPMYYDRDDHGMPLRWLQSVKHALETLGWRYNSDRMVEDYSAGTYRPAAGLSTSDLRG